MGAHNLRKVRSPRESEHTTTSADDESGVSLIGESGKQVARNIQALALGRVGIDSLGSAYSIRPDGTIGVRISSVSLTSLSK
jgi:hypothetical protein